MSVLARSPVLMSVSAHLLFLGLYRLISCSYVCIGSSPVLMSVLSVLARSYVLMSVLTHSCVLMSVLARSHVLVSVLSQRQSYFCFALRLSLSCLKPMRLFLFHSSFFSRVCLVFLVSVLYFIIIKRLISSD